MSLVENGDYDWFDDMRPFLYLGSDDLECLWLESLSVFVDAERWLLLWLNLLNSMIGLFVCSVSK